jgi:hypothetical protein
MTLKRRKAPLWPYRPEDEICLGAWRLRLSSGVLLASAAARAKADGAGFPAPVSTVAYAGDRAHLYRWGDVSSWLSRNDIRVIGPELHGSKLSSGVANEALVAAQIARSESDVALANLQRHFSGERVELESQIRQLKVDKAELENSITAMMRRAPGLLSGLEILRRAVPTAAIKDPAVYFLIHKKEIVYIGQSVNPYGRILSHLSNGQKNFSTVCLVHCEEGELSALEAAYIRYFRPRYNSVGVRKSEEIGGYA